MECYIKDYPRPQFVRRNWESLNGIWDFAFDDVDCGEKEKWYVTFPGTLKIQVPFSYETKLSGIGETKAHSRIWYRKKLQLSEKDLWKKRLVLNFEGSDYITKVWVNGQYTGSHKGGYTRFSFDISNLIQDGENEIVVKVEDSFDTQQPRGKQRWISRNYDCWYEQTTGIWKTVWIEYVPEMSLKYVKMTPDMQHGCLELDMEVCIPEIRSKESISMETVVSFAGGFVTRNVTAVSCELIHICLELTEHRADQTFSQTMRVWTPGKPDLYDVKFRLICNEKNTDNPGVLDEVESYFGMRDIQIDGTKILLNGLPVYQRLLLEQGYWENSGLTAPGEDALIEEIDKIRELGYNGIRIHQKTEDEKFLYWCDVKGLLTWCEMPSAYWYTDKMVNQFTEEWMAILKQHYNHPSVIVWTPFNESWGISNLRINTIQQHFSQAIYHLTKSFDNQKRPVIVNDGWDHTISDILTLHDYEEQGKLLKERYIRYEQEILNGEICFDGKYHTAMAQGFVYQGQPIIISEFGGIAFKRDTEGLGYGEKASDEEEFIARFDKITTAIKEIPYVCGYCYTQATDVQQEMNGLMDAGRKFKVDAGKIREINERSVGCWRGYGSI